MELKSPPKPSTVTVRRNPPRKARATPSTNVAAIPMSSISPSTLKGIPSFPLEDIIQIDVPKIYPPSELSKPPKKVDTNSENLSVFLRIRPLEPPENPKKNTNGGHISRSRWKHNAPQKETKNHKKKKNDICLTVNNSQSVTLLPPQSLQDSRRVKSEVYDGFSHVFSSESSQNEVYERMMGPLVDDFMRGRSGMLAALGPTGSGKTHTIFGCPRQPGMVSLALQKIFSPSDESGSRLPRSVYISMFEIQTERGKGEKIIDLSLDGADLCLQQSTIKGLQEIMVSDILQAESLIGRGMLKRATAMTNSNNQSSRSQCIINIRSGSNTTDREINEHAVLTIVDLAGAEREKRTGNQGVRLLESNFINNTSMVFGLCLRALLEHQKNPKKPFQKHFQNSLLTRHLRDYMEGKKRMTLILTVKQGEDDYLDTSFLLRQASPYMKIKFNNVDELSSFNCQKRNIRALPRIDECKRRKFNELDACMINGRNAREDLIHVKEMVPKQHHEQEPQEVSISTPRLVKLECNASVAFEAKRSRDIQIMQDFSKALWNVLKDYKKKLEVSENIVQSLKENLIKKNTQYLELKKELKDLRNHCSCSKEVLAESSSLVEVFADTESGAIFSPQLEQCGANNVNQMGNCDVVGFSCCHNEGSEVHHCQATLDACSPKLKGSECSNNLETYDANGTQHQEIYLHKHESFPSKESRIADLCELKYAGAEDGISNADGTGLGHAESVFSSSQSQILLADNSCPSMEQCKIHDELEKKMLVPSSSPTEDVQTAIVCNIKNFSAGKTKIDTFSRRLNLEKPKGGCCLPHPYCWRRQVTWT